ncbi:putative U3 small nucleolar RNA-associated protein 7 [Polyrhizophydium stewartii]|uniref:U3 small nucleolar RNA-associated protein 7 n=1 Tax=Polyrhizophydium stewartii TaxID=2732419 RepID=A0ABR4NEI4_9FUNG
MSGTPTMPLLCPAMSNSLKRRRDGASTAAAASAAPAAAQAQRSDKARAASAIESIKDRAAAKYSRGDKPLPIKSITDKKLKGTLRRTHAKQKEAAEQAAQSEMLLTEDSGFLEAEGMERTWKFRQAELKKHVDANTESKMFDLKLPEFGPYALDYTRNGRHLLIGGRKGHIASFDWQSGKLACELHVRETVKDVKWLHNETMFAVAQKKFTYIYDKSGMELHCLRDHIEANRLEFLPYHFLLATVGNAGFLKYQDTSTGQLVAEHRTKLGKCDTMAQNPYNAVIHLGHANGTVTLWAPSMSTPLVKMLCHKGPVQAIAIDTSGTYMATTGLDGQMKVWDVRTYKTVQDYFTPAPASHLAISQKGLLAVGYGPHLSVWKDAFRTKQKEPYMTHLFAGSPIQDLHFCPFEDVLGCGHASGISSLVIPGSGEPNFDTMEANPYQTRKQRQESEVHSLLDKIQPDMITLDPTVIGRVDRSHQQVIADEKRREWEANHPTEKFVPVHRARGKSSSLRRYLRKSANVVDARREEMRERLEKQAAERERERKRAKGESVDKPRTALDRFDVGRK